MNRRLLGYSINICEIGIIDIGKIQPKFIPVTHPVGRRLRLS